MYKALDIAKYIINKCTNDNIPISNMQLQKILYCIQREFLKSGKEAFSDEMEAWQIGPVVSEIYYKYCGFGAMPIRMKYTIDICDYDVPIINSIVEGIRILKPWDLVKDVHRKGSAYDIVYDNGVGDHKIIPKALIKKRG